MKFEKLIDAYSQKHSQAAPLNIKGVYRVKAYDTFTLSLEKSLEEGKFFLYTALKQIASDEEREVFELALQGNLFQAATGGASIGYSPTTHLLILFQSFEEEQTEYPLFEQEIERFCSYLIYWQEKLKAVETKPIADPFKGLQERDKLKVFFA